MMRLERTGRRAARYGFSNGTRLAIIASQIPFCRMAIDEGGGWAIAGYAGPGLYAVLTIAIIKFAVMDWRARRAHGQSDGK